MLNYDVLCTPMLFFFLKNYIKSNFLEASSFMQQTYFVEFLNLTPVMVNFYMLKSAFKFLLLQFLMLGASLMSQ